MDPTIFRSYDIRGIVDRELSEHAVERIGGAYGTLAKERGFSKLTVGRDCRDSSPRLFAALVRGITSTGVDVLDVGVVATPMQYFSIPHFHADGGVQITGSHNPPEYNGLKLTLGKESLHGEDIQRIGRLAQSGALARGQGRVESVDVITPYSDYCVNNIHLGPRKLKVVLDAGNGTAGPFAPPIFERLGVEVIPLFCDMDPTFPNHHPDPTVEANLVDLKRAVAHERADLGIAFDGDGDRIGVIDEQGHTLWGDQLMVLFSRAILKEKPGATIVAEVKCSKTLYDDIARHGGRGIMWKTGHSLIKSKMKEVGAEIAGEMSGHIFFKHRYFGFDDATYAGLRLLEILSQSNAPLSSLLADLPKTYATPELRLDCPEALKFALVAAAIAHFKALGHDVIDVDGARVTFADGWGLVRASNTQPILVLRFEAETEARQGEIRSYVEGELENVRRKLAP
ncbi:MAG: phosphomannomutase/phosphoglucomutase [Deltaproteobacteria bacterium]|nr:phosphomannomutase/phosphoglucomutase [Deltaproteobacteria bacterium]